MLDPEEYVSGHVLPHFERVLRVQEQEEDRRSGMLACLAFCQPKMSKPIPQRRRISRAGLVLLQKLLVFIYKTPALLCSPFVGRPLVPNRNGDLCRISDLYDPNEAIFAATFEGDHSKFPHPGVDTATLKKMGFNWLLTKSSFMSCAQHIDNEYKRQGPSTQLYRRASDVWTGFNRRITQFNPAWNAEDIQSLSEYHIVPISSCPPSSYRYKRQSNEALVAMKDVMFAVDIPVLWTRKDCSVVPPSVDLTTLFNFEPVVKDVLKHLVDLTSMVGSRCRIGEKEFYEDLEKTYDWLNREDNRAAAGPLLKNQFRANAVWLNEDAKLGNISQRGEGSVSRRIDSLAWRRAVSILDGISYDAPESDIFALKESLTGYKALLIAAGMNVVKDHLSSTAIEKSPDHRDTILGKALREMRTTRTLCDMTIIINGERLYGHRVVLATFSSYFRAMFGSSNWVESSGILNLDIPGEIDTPTTEKYATARSVAMVLDWLYQGEVSVDDSKLESADSVADRLDLYLEVLQITDVWDIPTLKTHIENRIIRRAREFIRVENVRAVTALVNHYNAKEVAKHCQAFLDLNKEVVEHIQSRVSEYRNQA